MIIAIRNGIKDALVARFDESHNVYYDAVEQGFENPCFFISLVDWYSDPLIMGREKWHTQYNITFYPQNEDEPTDECYGMIPVLKELLRMITLENGDVLRGIDMDAKVADGLLQFYVTYKFETIERSESSDAIEGYTEGVNYGG